MAARTWEGCTLPEEQAAPGRHRNPLEIEGDDRGFGLHALDGKKSRIRQPLGRRAENHDLAARSP